MTVTTVPYSNSKSNTPLFSFLSSPNFTHKTPFNIFPPPTMRHSKLKTPTTTYYSTLHDSITSLCKTIIPLGSLKKQSLISLNSAEQRLSELRSDNLKWQQESFHQMIKLMSLFREDIVTEAEVSAFRTHLVDTIIASPPPHQDHRFIICDKLLFLQELLNAKCISEGEYNSSKRPLLQRLEAQGGSSGDIENKDIVTLNSSEDTKQNSEEEWSVIDLKDEQSFVNKENSISKKEKLKKASKKIKEAALVFGFGSSHKNSKEKSIFDSPKTPSKENNKRKPFKLLFQTKNREGDSVEDNDVGLVDHENEVTPLSLNEKSDSEAYFGSYQLGEKNSMKNKLHFDDRSPSKVAGDKINKELSIIKTELRSTNTNKGGPRSFYDQYGVMLEKEFKDHMCKDAKEEHEMSIGWTTFEDDENLHPNLFVHNYNSLQRSSTNPFYQGCWRQDKQGAINNQD